MAGMRVHNVASWQPMPSSASAHQLAEVPPPNGQDKSKATGEALSICLLGRFHTSLDGREIDDPAWKLRKVKSVIKLLALASGNRFHRGELMEMLWPELDPEAAANNLHKALYVARRVLEPNLGPNTLSRFLHLRNDFVILDPPGPLWIDVLAFRDAAALAAESSDPNRYEEALALYTGELLPENRYDDWAIRDRETLSALRTQLLLQLAAVRESRNELDRAIDALQQVVATDPAHEEAHASLMRLLARSGHRHLALRQYQRLRDALQRELDMDPDRDTESLFQQIRVGQFSLDSTGDVAPWTAASTTLVLHEAREERIRAQLLEALFDAAGGAVLVAGPPGTGKTRLAYAVTQQASERGAVTAWIGPREWVRYQGSSAFMAISRTLESELRGREAQSQPISEVAGFESLASGTVSSRADLRTVALAVDDQPLPFEAVADLYRDLASQAPVLVVLDTLHAADEDSVHLLHYLVRALTGVRVLFLGILRSDILPTTPLSQLVERLLQEPQVRMLNW